MTTNTPPTYDEPDDVSFDDWFRCPDCSATTDGALDASLMYGFANSSLKLACRNCGYTARHRDPRSTNWRPFLNWKLKLSSAYHTHPVVKQSVLDAGQCPACSSRTVSIELETKQRSTGFREFDREYWLTFHTECLTCGFEYTHELEHN